MHGSLLIRRPGRPRRRQAGTCFAVDTRERVVGSATLERIDDAPPSIRGIAGRSLAARRPLVVVCTHGRRDVCCAERGRPLAGRSPPRFPDATWESTHVGGDRFAGNMVVFPHGLYFGRVEPDEGPGIAHAYAEGRIGSLERYRGAARRTRSLSRRPNVPSATISSSTASTTSDSSA